MLKFSQEKDETVAGSSSILPLHPFLDNKEIVRVGDRLIPILKFAVKCEASNTFSFWARIKCHDCSNFHELHFHAGVQ